MPEFHGFPVAALDFYDDLEVDNTKSFWTAHKHVYDEAVRAPMVALADALAPEFAPDGRSARSTGPTATSGSPRTRRRTRTTRARSWRWRESTGWYVEISPRGVRVSGGFYWADGERMAAIRAAIDDDRTGPALKRLLTKLRKQGFEIHGEQLKTRPRGYDADHPRIDLLRHKQLMATRSYGFEKVIHTPGLLTVVRDDWRATRPLVTWLQRVTS